MLTCLDSCCCPQRFWHVKVRALAASHQWDDLRKFANERKSPIGYKPFAERCIEQRLPPDQVRKQQRLPHPPGPPSGTPSSPPSGARPSTSSLL
jgi:hypothetical protein